MTNTQASTAQFANWRYIVAAAIAVLTACQGATSSAPTPAAPEKFVVVFGTAIGLQAALAYAKAKGYFTSEGIDLQIIVSNSQTPTVMSGQADLAQGGIPAALAPVGNGKETSMVYAVAGNGYAAYVAALPRIKTVAECKTLVTQLPGTASYSWAVYWRKQFAATYDIKTQPGVAAIATTLGSGQADCAISASSTFTPLVDAGKARYVVDPTKPQTMPTGVSLPEFADATWWGVTENLRSKRRLVERFLAAFQKGLKGVRASSSAAEIAKTMRTQTEWQTIQEDALTSDVKQVLPSLSPHDGYMRASDWPGVLQFMVSGGTDLAGGVGDARWSYERRVDMSYYEKALGKP
jgi:ABC-type nitrate/sulfonate/bicarbonate transport system substrate-binding protein